MPTAEVRDELEALHINVQAVMQLWSKQRVEDTEEDLTPHLTSLCRWREALMLRKKWVLSRIFAACE
jgi:hypothetical protein